MLKQLGIHVDFLKSPVSIGIADKVIHVERPENLDDYGRMLKALYPETAGDVDAILQDIRKVMRYMAVLYGIENPLFKDLRHDTEYLSKTLLPWMGRFLATIGRLNRMNEPAEEHLRAFPANPALIDIIAQHFFRKTPAFFAMSYFSLYLDYRYPRGGTGPSPPPWRHTAPRTERRSAATRPSRTSIRNGAWSAQAPARSTATASWSGRRIKRPCIGRWTNHASQRRPCAHACGNERC
jgi:hypothetical protein